MLVSLKRTFPQARIDWLVQDTFAPAVAQHPDLNRIVPFDRRRFGSGRWLLPSGGREFARLLLSIRRMRYDLVLDCQGLARSALFTLATGAPVRVGFANAAELGWVSLTRRVAAPRSLHTVDRMLLLAQAVGCEPVRDLRLYSAPEDRAKVRGAFGLTPGHYAVIAPTTRWPGKLWAQDRYADLTARLLADPALGIERVVIVGGASERDQCRALTELGARDSRIQDLVGRTSIGELLALIESSRLIVGSDSAAVHIAVGFDRPLVALYGPTRVDLVGPYGRDHHVVQRISAGDRLDHKDESGGRALMERITVEDALACARSQLLGSATATVTSPPGPFISLPASVGAEAGRN